ncbi:MAG: OmpA family protein [Deltaproteobacteria bacterium]|nr:OmpA family protein [Deltaproteobacteria bacterium]
MARKRKHAAHENHERWLVSYADFITLLFAFFVVLFSSSQVDQRKVGKLARSIQGAFLELSIAPTPGSRNPIMDRGQFPGDTLQQLERLAKGPKDHKPRVLGSSGLKKLKKKLESQLSAENLSGKVRIGMDDRGLTITLAEGFFFDSGSAAVRKNSLPTLERISRLLRSLGNALRVEGHTDDRPIKTARFPSNWELSTARATYVVSYLIQHFEADPRQLSAAGYGEWRPTATNDTAEGRAMNRRVDIVVLSSEAMTQEPKLKPNLSDDDEKQPASAPAASSGSAPTPASAPTSAPTSAPVTDEKKPAKNAAGAPTGDHKPAAHGH